MDELVKLVAQKTGLPDAQARQATEVVVAFLKEKLPAPVAAQLEGALQGGGGGGLLGQIGGMLGG